MSNVFVKRVHLNTSVERAFQWHERPGALERLTPPWARIRLVKQSGGIKDGGRVVLAVPIGPFPLHWEAVHCDYIENRQFRDRQASGPFSSWEHTHSFESTGPDSCSLEDRIEYEAPLGPVGNLVGGPFIRSMLDRMFAYRHRITAHDLELHARYSGKRLHFLVSGTHGLVGSQLKAFLTAGGHQVTPITRVKPGPGEAGVWWNPTTGKLDVKQLQPVDVVVHLAGENIARRWTVAAKQEIRDSRGPATQRLCESLRELQPRPAGLLCASAIGFYGNRGDVLLDENGARGSGFLADVCNEWEAATAPTAEAGMRIANLRFGVVLSGAGGALAKMSTPFQFGIGGRLGSGRQYMSWIGIDDVLAAILHVAMDDDLRGAINFTAPQATTNGAFSAALGKVLRRPVLFPVPPSALRLVAGEMADEMLLSSTRVDSKRLREASFGFWHADLESVLRHVLGK